MEEEKKASILVVELSYFLVSSGSKRAGTNKISITCHTAVCRTVVKRPEANGFLFPVPFFYLLPFL